MPHVSHTHISSFHLFHHHHVMIHSSEITFFPFRSTESVRNKKTTCIHTVVYGIKYVYEDENELWNNKQREIRSSYTLVARKIYFLIFLFLSSSFFFFYILEGILIVVTATWWWLWWFKIHPRNCIKMFLINLKKKEAIILTYKFQGYRLKIAVAKDFFMEFY